MVLIKILITLLLLLKAEICFALINRKVVNTIIWEERINEVGRESSASGGAHFYVKNHHRIPRDSWDNSQNQDEAPAAADPPADNHAEFGVHA
ncbi:UNVERIFIED_CONTAM: hypothetical protein Sradi_5908200 [Sesamum radiatum]|uniref:Secreted protein n=1 Tax=Sesamum radiatum TaxID=300843 RepID=A0AAW2KRL1_SESRA